ncbi:uncharacterized protein LOC115797619 [Archocentrus centrarchus]|uniref:uncharacterized protein LOC115797619 n=1 Tax=Archocentrus centrarchus TaxID=63155 RepID=UPI0011EA31C6|nr:uncharacterized protein LOC115797619 [Archocentrus centrarchus]
MSLSVLLLLLMVCSTQASDFFSQQQASFFGTFTYYTKEPKVNGSDLLRWRYTRNSRNCDGSYSSVCPDSSCGYVLSELNKVDSESSGEWCQMEYIYIFPILSDDMHQYWLGGDWINGLRNTIRSWNTEVLLELRKRSDTGNENSSPQTTIIPVVRVPSNCQRDFSLLMFDPDGDDVKCRFGNTSSECDPCNPPSVLSLSPSCTLSFSPTNSSNEGPYAVQILMEDFPRQTITLNKTTQTIKTTNDAISKAPLQFVLLVDPAVPSCTGGDFLPRFLPPTPDHRAQLYTNVSQTLQISISAEAKNSTMSELLFSGPYNVIRNKTGPGEFTLTWTPLQKQAGQNHPICFVIQALSNGTKYHSELRCLLVGVGIKTTPAATTPTTSLPTTTPKTTHSPPANTPAYVAGLSMKLSSLVDLSHIDRDALLNQIKEALVKQGLPADITLQLRSSEPQIGATAAPSTDTT